MVLDIDGTLTPHDLAVFQARPDADKVIDAYVEKGYKVIYVTTRIPAFQGNLPVWLYKHGLPSGPIHVAGSDADRADPAGFKARVLRSYTDMGWKLAYGYGDSATDVLAYLAAGIPAQRIFALKRQGSDACEAVGIVRCLDGWSGHLEEVKAELARSR